MNFEPMTDDEIAASQLSPPGIYDFSIVSADEKLSAARSNPMIELRLEVSRSGGTQRIVRDYLLPQCKEKLMQAAMACGVIEKYLAGSLVGEDFVGKKGSVRLGVERGRKFPARNVVLEYVVESKVNARLPARRVGR